MDPQSVHDAVVSLKQGGVIIAPAETLFGFSTLYGNDEGVERIHTLKGRDPDEKPFLVLIGSIEMGRKIAHISDDLAAFLMKDLWPGHLTVIVNHKDGGTVAIRYPNTPFLNQLFQQIDLPFFSTSVNTTGEAPLNDYSTIVNRFGNGVDLVVPINPPESGIASTIVDFTGGKPRLIREGNILFKSIMDMYEHTIKNLN